MKQAATELSLELGRKVTVAESRIINAAAADHDAEAARQSPAEIASELAGDLSAPNTPEHEPFWNDPYWAEKARAYNY